MTQPQVPTHRRDPARADIRWGVRGGISFALVYCAWVTAVRVARGDEPFVRQGVTYIGVVATYLGVGLLAGTLVGALRPVTQSRVGAYAVGLVAGAVVAAGLAACVSGPPWRWDFADWLLLPVFTVVAGAMIGGELSKQRALPAGL